MLPDTNKIDTLLLCHRLHKLIAGIKVGDSSLTISIGMSICNEPISFIDLFIQADNAVYKAKARGKNRTEVYLNNS
jgi:diguanylate cyclase (GGDEF)-like protein